MATKDDIKYMATKADIARLEADINITKADVATLNVNVNLLSTTVGKVERDISWLSRLYMGSTLVILMGLAINFIHH